MQIEGSASSSPRFRARSSALSAVMLAAVAGSARAQTVVVDFEQFTTAPCTFNLTGPLLEELAPLGLHFSGPTAIDGGAVLDQCGNFAVNAHSGVKFLAFNAGTPPWASGGRPIDPETISFDQRATSVDIWVASGSGQATFQLDAFDGAVLVGSSNISIGQVWTLLSVSVAGGFTRVVLDASVGVFLCDDLSITFGPSTPPALYCFGDGSGVTCPCANNSPAGGQAGCLSSLGVGARLGASGIASIASDSLVLSGSHMPSAPILYFQGTLRANGGNGLAFGDGLRCAAGTIVRLKSMMNVSGMSQYPGPGDASVSVRGLVTAPGVRTYQAWYRNAAAFCTSATYNLTNGVELGWVP
jgi:hypothetical protein